jgi:hypothetical protein
MDTQTTAKLPSWQFAGSLSFVWILRLTITGTMVSKMNRNHISRGTNFVFDSADLRGRASQFEALGSRCCRRQGYRRNQGERFLPLEGMARFTTRVQLNGEPADEVYEALHRAMKAKGFSRFIAGDGRVNHMPHAEYNRVAETTIEAVRDDARAAADSVWSNSQVLVTEGSRAWIGLKEATAAEVAAG